VLCLDLAVNILCCSQRYAPFPLAVSLSTSSFVGSGSNPYLDSCVGPSRGNILAIR
jgi:hypothetical protein